MSNAGPDAATNVQVIDSIQSGFGNVHNITNGGVLTNDSIVWDIATIANGSNVILTFDVEVLGSGDYGNVATITGLDEVDPNPTDSVDVVTITPVPDTADLTLVKMVSDLTPGVGDTVTYTCLLYTSPSPRD